MMESFIEDCTAVILAGGENRRMPVRKAFIQVQGQKIIERNTKLLKSLFHECVIVTNEPEHYLYLNTVLLGDIHDVRGPMSGIVTALANAKTRWIFVTACDMPFLSRESITALYAGGFRKTVDAIVPVSPRGPEPLFAFYSTSLRHCLEKQLLQGPMSMKDFLQNKRVQYRALKNEGESGPGSEAFTNLNTPADIHRFLGKEDSLKFRQALERRRKCSV
jgi:molybdopterin-guanine dinucleotide biosynthesis protein A